MRVPSNNLPVIDFYLDYSASWDDYELGIAQQVLDTITQFELDGLIKINVYYFGRNVSTKKEAISRGATSAWDDIIKTIKETDATNVVVMTDSDMQHQGGSASTTVPGYVWFLWRDGENAQRITKLLTGDCDTQQYSFNTR
jgi:hypothetical protein